MNTVDRIRGFTDRLNNIYRFTPHTKNGEVSILRSDGAAMEAIILALCDVVEKASEDGCIQCYGPSGEAMGEAIDILTTNVNEILGEEE